MRFESTANDIYTGTQPPSPVRWLGLPFALFAVLPLAGALGLIPIESKDGGEAPVAIAAILGLILLAVGLLLLLFRRRLTVDLRDRTITRHKGVGPLSLSKTIRVTDGATLTFERRVIRGEKSSKTVWPVMVGSTEDRTIDILFCRTRHSSRQTAEGLAKLLSCAVIDRTDGTPRQREADELDLSLRERRQRSGQQPEPGAAPPNMRSTVTADENELVIQIPSHGFTATHIAGMMIATGPLWMLLVFMSTAEDLPEGVFLIAIVAIASLPFLLFETAIAWHAMRRFTVTASTMQLRIDEHGLRKRTTVLPAEKVEEVTIPAGKAKGLAAFVGGGHAITVSSDVGEILFGASLKQPETGYIAALLEDTLSAPIDAAGTETATTAAD